MHLCLPDGRVLLRVILHRIDRVLLVLDDVGELNALAVERGGYQVEGLFQLSVRVVRVEQDTVTMILVVDILLPHSFQQVRAE